MELFEIRMNRRFMQDLLTGQVFDHFLVEEADISTFNHFMIDGRILPAFYDDGAAPDEEFSSWEKIRPTCFDLIKGKRLPLNFKFVLHAPKAIVNELLLDERCTLAPEHLKSLVLTIRFSNNATVCVSATGMNTFVPDKSIEQLWDRYVASFLANYTTDTESNGDK